MEEIKFENVSFKYPLWEEEALKNINFQISHGEFIIICGPSGCGKTTLLRNIKKNMAPYGYQKGMILYKGMQIEEVPDDIYVREVGYVMQDTDSQIVTDKVYHELAFGLESLGISNDEILRRTAEMAEFFGISSWYKKDVSLLSGGQKQILNLASIMVMQPEVLVLDEPLAQLDPVAAREFVEILFRINNELGTTVIMSEHHLENIYYRADKVMLMSNGQIELFDTPESVATHIVKSKNSMECGLPVSVRLFKKLCMDEIIKDSDNIPVSLKEGRSFLKKLGNINIDYNVYEKNGKPDTGYNINGKPEYSCVLKNVSFRYERKAGDILSDLSIKIRRGEFVCILGGNGSGKTTLLKVISGLLKAYDGKLKLNGTVRMLPQNPMAVFTEITVEEELANAIKSLEISKEQMEEKLENMLKYLELLNKRESNPYDLSGGQKQKLALGKILLQNFDILLLDEPTKGLDPFFKYGLGKIIKDLTQKGITVIMVSHDLEFAADYCDSCAMLFQGKIVSMEESKKFFGENYFYTTQTALMTKGILKNAVTVKEAEKQIKFWREHEKHK